ncbi:MAG: PIN domain-containing protein [Deltaproteobacteria bacterium]|nr:PIN domain-containing protein [Deltaproteobacteria bacterium]
MKDDVFIDTNLWIYLYSDKDKGDKVRRLIDESYEEIVISTQVIGEIFSVLTKKRFTDKKKAKEIAVDLIENFKVVSINETITTKAIDVCCRYDYSYWDSLIVATALENDCSTLFSEDLQDNQIIDGKLKIVNPFV